MQDLSANPLDCIEGGPLNRRREQLSEWLDATSPDLSKFHQRGGKMFMAARSLLRVVRMLAAGT